MTQLHAALFGRLLAITSLTLSFAACDVVSTTHATDPAATSAATTSPAATTTPASTTPAAQPDPASFSTATYSVNQAAGSVTIKVLRTGSAAKAFSVEYQTTNGSARAPADYTPEAGTLNWSENDATSRTITVPISNATPFSGDRTFYVMLNNPTPGDWVITPGTAAVIISGDASAGVGTLELADSAYTVSQNAGSVTVSVDRIGGAVGATSVEYSTANGSAIAGTDYTATSGTLNWANDDSAAKSFKVPVSNARPFAGDKAFTVALGKPTASAIIGLRSHATVTIAGDSSPPVGTLHLAASSYTVAQNGGSVRVTVDRTGGSEGAASVAYYTANGTATAGTNYTATSGALHWTAGDASAKSFTVPVSSATPFTGSKTFKVALEGPSAGAAISSPGTATVTIAGDASVGSLHLGAASYSIGQSGGSLSVSVDRVGGSSGAIGIAYATQSGSAVAGRDFTAASGTLKWANADTSTRTFSIPISNATPFAGTKSFTIVLASPAGGAALGTPGTAIASITGDAVAAVGSLKLSASGYAVGQAAGHVSVTVNRTGGSSGAVSVSYATANGTAVSGTEYSATSGTLKWASGDASSQSISIPVSNATPFTGSKAFTVSLSGATGGATLASPDSGTVTIAGSGTNTPPSSVFWVYYNGVYNWGGDYSYEATPNYKDTSGDPLEGPYDIAVTITSPWGGFLPYAGGTVPLWNFNDAGRTYLTFAFKPTIANQKAQVYFVKVGDVPVGIDINLFSGEYGPAPQPGVWATYKIPLSQLGVLNTSVYKFAIQDMTGSAGHVFYLDNIGFE